MTKTKIDNSLSSVVSSLPNYLLNTEIVSTGIYILDHILNGGIESGSFVQLLSESAQGKTTISLQIASNYCSLDKKVVYVDTEGSVSNEILTSIGIDEYLNKNFFYIKESTFDEVEKYLDMFIKTDEISLVIIDSLPNLINKCFTDLKKGISITTNTTLYTSRPLTNFMNKYKALANTKKFSLLFTNHYRQRIDMTKGSVNKEYGGKNVKYNSDVLLKINKITSTGVNKDFKSMFEPLEDGFDLEFEIVKSNKRVPEVSFPAHFIYGKGISNLNTFLYALIKNGNIRKDGTYYEYKLFTGTIKTNGIVNFIKELTSMKVNPYDDYEIFIQSYYNNNFK